MNNSPLYIPETLLKVLNALAKKRKAILFVWSTKLNDAVTNQHYAQIQLGEICTCSITFFGRSE